MNKLIEKICNEFKLSDLISFSKINEGGNLNYLIKTKKGNFVIKIYQYRREEEVSKESFEIINSLIENENLPFPYNLKSKKGDFIEKIKFKNKNYFVSVTKFTKGQKYLDNPTKEKIISSAIFLANFHKKTLFKTEKNNILTKKLLEVIRLSNLKFSENSKEYFFQIKILNYYNKYIYYKFFG